VQRHDINNSRSYDRESKQTRWQTMTPMKKPRDLQQTVAGRCTSRAWGALKLLREHPAFPELIERLATIEGTLLNRDVEIALSKIVKARPLKH
jgi:hypothetical protein